MQAARSTTPATPAWPGLALQRKAVTAPIVGATSLEQLRDLLAAPAVGSTPSRSPPSTRRAPDDAPSCPPIGHDTVGPKKNGGMNHAHLPPALRPDLVDLPLPAGMQCHPRAVLIDPVFEQVRRDAALIAELGLTLKWTLETHVHADHITGGWLLKQRLGSGIAWRRRPVRPVPTGLLADGDRVEFGRRALEVRATPAIRRDASPMCSMTSMAFTGDCLLIRGSGRTDFQQGDPRQLYRAVRSRIFSLPRAACSIRRTITAASP